MALSNLYGWNKSEKEFIGGTACGASDKATACGAPDKTARISTACGASDKAVKCGSACAAQDDGKVNGKIVMEV
ncbi:MAG: hypothetical protein PWP20_897 [Eubacteriaceae bacterium]|jgi:ACGX-repeat protein|nr:hypothetical protein [Eubacteriaceae bacterium]